MERASQAQAWRFNEATAFNRGSHQGPRETEQQAERFNEATAFNRGSPTRASTMHSRKRRFNEATAFNRGSLDRGPRRIYGDRRFNEATAFNRGSLQIQPPGTAPRRRASMRPRRLTVDHTRDLMSLAHDWAASMRPRRLTVDHPRCRPTTATAGRSFNEATAFNRGSPPVRPRRRAGMVLLQ